MLKTRHRIIHISIFAAVIMLVSGCGGGMMSKVKHSAANNIHRVAIVSVLPGQSGTSKQHKNKIFNKTVDIASSGLTKVKSWKIKHPKTFWKSQAYNDFSARVTAIWSMYTKTIFGTNTQTGFGVKMPNLPFGSNIAFAGSKQAATNKEFEKLCNTLNVDALAL